MEGIRTQVLLDDVALKIEEDGYLGENLNNNLRLRCLVPKRSPQTIGFIVDGKKNIVVLQTHFSDQNTSLVVKKVPVSQTEDGIFTTKYATNNIRFAVFKPAGKFEIWEIAIVSQDGSFFLVEQKTYEAQWFRGENSGALCPDFEKWPQLLEFLGPIVEREYLPPIQCYVSSPTPKPNDLKPQQGRVQWWNLALQMGIIVLDAKGTAARVHWKSLPFNSSGLRKLEAGQLVHFQKLLPIAKNEGSRETNSSLALEARVITPV